MVSRALGKTYALQQAAKLREGATDLAQGKVTLAQVFALYQRHRTPRKKSATGRKADARRVELWTRILGGKKDPHKISLGEWDRFIDLLDKWLREAEKLAEVELHKGSLWHAYRRKWPTERKHL